MSYSSPLYPGRTGKIAPRQMDETIHKGDKSRQPSPENGQNALVQERRKRPRTQQQHWSKLTLRCDESKPPKSVEARLVNLNSGGLQVETVEPLQVGSLVSLLGELHRPHSCVAISGEGRVAHWRLRDDRRARQIGLVLKDIYWSVLWRRYSGSDLLGRKTCRCGRSVITPPELTRTTFEKGSSHPPSRAPRAEGVSRPVRPA